jgi:septal ring factor EnvC (AmiA/AmiB activator)
VSENTKENADIEQVRKNTSLLADSFKRYDEIKASLNRMIKQSQRSKDDVEKMLRVFQESLG